MNTTTKATPDAAPTADINAVLEDLAALRRDFAAVMEHLKAGGFKGASDAAESTLGALGDRASQIYDSVVGGGERSGRAVGRYVEERPVVSLLLAFGVGFIASRLLRR